MQSNNKPTIAQQSKPEENAIVLEPDVREYFPDSKSANKALRTLVSIVPEKRKASMTPEKPTPSPDGKKPSPKPGGKIPDAIWAAIGAVAVALLTTIGAVVASYFDVLKVTLPAQLQATQTAAAQTSSAAAVSQEYFLTVSADDYPFADMNVPIEQGDRVEIIVQGEDPVWDCGRGLIGPAGYTLEKYSDHPSPAADACELVGYIGRPDSDFRVGAYTRLIAENTGSLYLGINDATDKFPGNSGSVSVKVVITREP